MSWTIFLGICSMCCLSMAVANDLNLCVHQRLLPSSPPKRSPTLHGQGWHNLLIHVIHVVSHDEVSRVVACTAHPVGVYVEGSHQWVDARVIDNLEATEDFNLLPAVQALPQSCCHLTQSLPEDRKKRNAGMGWVWARTGMRSLRGTTWEICINKTQLNHKPKNKVRAR